MRSGEKPSSQPLGAQAPHGPCLCVMKTSASLCENDAWISDGEEVELSGMLISLMRLSSTQPAECSGCLLTGRTNTKSPLVYKEDICLSYLGRVHEDLCACDHKFVSDDSNRSTV